MLAIHLETCQPITAVGIYTEVSQAKSSFEKCLLFINYISKYTYILGAPKETL